MFLLTEASMPILMFPPWSTCTHSSSMYMVFLSILWASPQISSLQRSFIWPYPLLQRVTRIPSILYLPFCLRTLNVTYSFRSVLLGFCLFDMRSHVSPVLKLLCRWGFSRDDWIPACISWVLRLLLCASTLLMQCWDCLLGLFCMLYKYCIVELHPYPCF